MRENDSKLRNVEVALLDGTAYTHTRVVRIRSASSGAALLIETEHGSWGYPLRNMQRWLVWWAKDEQQEGE